MPGSRRTAPLPANWGTVRNIVLARDPNCRWGKVGLQDEHGETCSQPSTQVDHYGRADDHRLEALRGICEPHHIKRNSRQGNNARAVIRNLRLRPPDRHPAYLPSVPADEGMPMALKVLPA